MNRIDAVGKQLAEQAMVVAVSAAKCWLRNMGESVTDSAKLALLLEEELKAAVPGALDDAREAMALRMDQVAVATFGASMQKAGIAAAKRYAGVAL